MWPFSKRPNHTVDIGILYDRVHKLERKNECEAGRHEWMLANMGYSSYGKPEFEKAPVTVCRHCYKHLIEPASPVSNGESGK